MTRGDAVRARVLLLGGTSEARRLAALLERHRNLAAVSSLAGRVRDPSLPVGEVRVGGFGGIDGLVRWLRQNDIAAIVDATHPFANRMTSNAIEAANQLNIPHIVLRRPSWVPTQGDAWHWADTIAEVPALLPTLGERVFLTTGRTDLKVFAESDLWFLVRTVDSPEPPTPPRTTVILDRGPFTVDGELALLREHRIDVLVTKNSGGQLTAAKLTAARELGLPVVVVRRPPLPAVPTVDTEREAVTWLEKVTRDSGEV